MALLDTKNIVAITGTFTNRQGEEKKSYLTVGTLFIYDDGGFGIKLDAVPTNFDGNLKVYDKEQKPQQQTGQHAPQGQQPQQGSYNQQPQHHQQYQQQGAGQANKSYQQQQQQPQQSQQNFGQGYQHQGNYPPHQ